MPTTLTVVNGKLRVNKRGEPLILSPRPTSSSDEPCCCGCSQDGTSFPCTITFVHVDENRCEDDVFGLFRINPETNVETRISTLNLVSSPPGCCNSGCPQTRIEIPLTLYSNDFSKNCEIRFVLRFEAANCCNTYTRFSLIAGNGSVLTGTYFSQGGYDQTWTAKNLCGTASAP